MIKEINHIIVTMMTNLKDVRRVTDIHIIGSVAVRFVCNQTQFDVRGAYPMITVHEVEGNMLVGSQAAREIEKQLNGEPIVEVEEETHIDSPEYHDLLCAHVDGMSDDIVQSYNEHCGGPDLDTMQTQRTWLKTHFLHMSYNKHDMLDIVCMLEGVERSSQLDKALVEHSLYRN